MTEGGGQKAEDREQKSEDREQKAEDRGQRTEGVTFPCPVCREELESMNALYRHWKCHNLIDEEDL